MGDLVANNNVFALGRGGGRQTNDTTTKGNHPVVHGRRAGGQATQGETPKTPHKATTYSEMAAVIHKGALTHPQ